MRTEQEQIEEIEKMLKYAVADYKHLKKKGVCYCYAETLIESGYGDVSEYKSEIERLRQEVRDTDKMARNTIEQYRAKNEELENALKQSEDNYSRAFERLKAQEREIERLQADLNHQIDATNDAENLADHLKHDLDKARKQAQIDVLNKVKERAVGLAAIETYHICNLIDELIKEVQDE